MPKIPMANMPGNTKVIDHSARAIGIPQDFGMESPKAILKASNLVMEGATQIGNAIMKYHKVMRDKEDQLAIDEANAAYRKRQLDLELKMKENPNNVEQFGRWAEDNDIEWEAEEKQYTERMSEQAKRQFKALMNEKRYADIRKRQSISTIARTTNLYNRTKGLFQEQCRIGDFDSAIQTIHNAQAGDTKLFSAEEERTLLEEYLPQQQQLNEIYQAEQNNDLSMIEKLSAIKADGVYVNFDKLSQEKRMELIRNFKGKKATGNTELIQATLADSLRGKMSLTIEDLNKKHDNKEINNLTYISLYKLIKEHEQRVAQDAMTDFKVNTIQSQKPPQTTAQIQKDFNDGKITRQEFLEKMEIASTYEAATAKAKSELAKLNEQNYADSLVGKLYQMDIPLHPADNAIAKQDYYKQAMEKISNPKLLQSTLNTIDQIFADGLNGKGVFDTPEGKQIKKWFDDTYFNSKGGYWHGLGTEFATWDFGNDNRQDLQSERAYYVLGTMANYLAQGKTFQEIKPLIEEMVANFNEVDIKNIMEEATDHNTMIAKRIRKRESIMSDNAAISASEEMNMESPTENTNTESGK
jgi:hypothetical protein